MTDMGMPVLTPELARDLDFMDARFVRMRMSGIQNGGIMFRTFGHALALMSTEIPNDQYNSVRGLTADDEIYLEDIVQFYVDHHVACRMDIIPSTLNASIAIKLAQSGFTQVDFNTVFYGEAVPIEVNSSPNLTIQEVSPVAFSEFLDTYLAGWGVSGDFAKKAKSDRLHWIHSMESTMYTAYYNGQPAGAAVLYVENDMAYLAGASTKELYRGCGVQTALLKHRMHAAWHKGCKLVTSQARFGSSSQRNMQRAGLQVAYTKALWSNNR